MISFVEPGVDQYRVLLTARPKVWMFVRADKTDNKFRGVWKKVDGVNRLAVLAGANSRTEGVTAVGNIWTGIRENGPDGEEKTWEHRKYWMQDLGTRKVERFKNYCRLFPELAGQLVFFGDDGQADFSVAAPALLEHKVRVSI